MADPYGFPDDEEDAPTGPSGLPAGYTIDPVTGLPTKATKPTDLSAAEARSYFATREEYRDYLINELDYTPRKADVALVAYDKAQASAAAGPGSAADRIASSQAAANERADVLSAQEAAAVQAWEQQNGRPLQRDVKGNYFDEDTRTGMRTPWGFDESRGRLVSGTPLYNSNVAAAGGYRAPLVGQEKYADPSLFTTTPPGDQIQGANVARSGFENSVQRTPVPDARLTPAPGGSQEERSFYRRTGDMFSSDPATRQMQTLGTEIAGLGIDPGAQYADLKPAQQELMIRAGLARPDPVAELGGQLGIDKKYWPTDISNVYGNQATVDLKNDGERIFFRDPNALPDQGPANWLTSTNVQGYRPDLPEPRMQAAGGTNIVGESYLGPYDDFTGMPNYGGAKVLDPYGLGYTSPFKAAQIANNPALGGGGHGFREHGSPLINLSGLGLSPERRASIEGFINVAVDPVTREHVGVPAATSASGKWDPITESYQQRPQSTYFNRAPRFWDEGGAAVAGALPGMSSGGNGFETPSEVALVAVHTRPEWEFLQKYFDTKALTGEGHDGPGGDVAPEALLSVPLTGSHPGYVPGVGQVLPGLGGQRLRPTALPMKQGDPIALMDPVAAVMRNRRPTGANLEDSFMAGREGSLSERIAKSATGLPLLPPEKPVIKYRPVLSR